MLIIYQIASSIKGDRAIWASFLLLCLVGLLAVYSTAGALTWQDRGISTTSYFLSHLLHVLIAIGLAYFCHRLHYRYYQKVGYFLMLVSVPLLVLTLAMGRSVNEASRWLELPFLPFGFQTSDIAKLALIIYVVKN